MSNETLITGAGPHTLTATRVLHGTSMLADSVDSTIKYLRSEMNKAATVRRPLVRARETGINIDTLHTGGDQIALTVTLFFETTHV